MLSLLRLFADIALLRRGPEEVPASAFLLAATIFAYFVVNLGLSLVLPPVSGPWLLHLLVDIAFTMLWYAALMRIAARRERFLQTTTAVFGYQTVLAPLWIGATWLAGRDIDASAWRLPVAVIGLAVIAWVLAANGRILRSALEQPMPVCVILVLLQVFLGQLLLLGLFSGGAGA